MDNSKKKCFHIVMAPCLCGLLAVLSVGCLEDYMENEDYGVQVCDEFEECTIDQSNTWRCAGEESQLCRKSGQCLYWTPMEDCSNIAGGVCPMADGETSTSQPVCTGDYWVDGYCPDALGPASSDCGGVAETGCCDSNQDATLGDNKLGDKFLVCEDGVLWCYQCGYYYYDYYYTDCTWSTALVDPKDSKSPEMGYGCWAEDPKDPNVIVDSDPTGTLPASCTP